jgi:FKBP-type peptidyl-prolyl cis-trans isomerase
MSVGEKVMLLSWPEKAYGRRGYPPLVPTSSKVLFEMRLLGCCTKEKIDGMPWMDIVRADIENESRQDDEEEAAATSLLKEKQKEEREAKKEEEEIRLLRKQSRTATAQREKMLTQVSAAGTGGATGSVNVQGSIEE